MRECFVIVNFFLHLDKKPANKRSIQSDRVEKCGATEQRNTGLERRRKNHRVENTGTSGRSGGFNITWK